MLAWATVGSAGYWLHLPRGPRNRGDLYHQGCLSKRVNLADKAERRLLVVELLQRNLNQTRLAEVLDLSRQTLHNYRESYRLFGVNGLLHGYSPSRSVSDERQGRLHVGKRRSGSKARELEALRRAEKMPTEEVTPGELAWDGEAVARYALEEAAIEEVVRVDLAATEAVLRVDPPTIEAMPEGNQSSNQAAADPISPEGAPAPVAELPYVDNHDWEASRYAGIFSVLLVLMSQWQRMERLFRLFGNGWRIFHVFALMAVRNIRSIEQFKHDRREEAGRILGLGRLSALDTLWTWFHDVAGKSRAGTLRKKFFADQIRCGLVGCQLWFTDGHLLPYSGQDKVHAAGTRSGGCRCPDRPIWSLVTNRGASSISRFSRIFLPPADGLPLYVSVFIEAIENAARAAFAYTARLRAFGLGKERPMAPRILVWCSSGRGRWA